MIAGSLFLNGVEIDRHEHDDSDAVVLRGPHVGYIAIHVRADDIERAEQLAAELLAAAARMRAHPEFARDARVRALLDAQPNSVLARFAKPAAAQERA